MHRIWRASLIVAVLSTSIASAESDGQGQVCFGKKGSTELDAILPTIIDVLDGRSNATRIGRCRLVAAGADARSLPTLAIWDGKQRVAILGSCGGQLLVRGIVEGPVRVGDRATVVADPLLACERSSGRKMITCAWSNGLSESSVRYEVRVSSMVTDAALRGEQLAKTLAGGRIVRIDVDHCGAGGG